MQTALAATWIYFLFGLTFTAGNANRNQSCQDQSGVTYESANCDSVKRTCKCWNMEGSEINWERYVDYGTGYMRAPMSGASTNSVARLASPCFRATGNQQCTLQFQYYYGNCQLSVYLDNDISSPELFWRIENSTGTDFRDSGQIRLPHSNCSHRIIFEAKKLERGPPIYTNDEVNIGNIEFNCSGPLTPPTSARGRTVTTPSSLSPRVSPTGTTAASPSTTSDLSSSRAGGSGMLDTEGTGTGRNIHLIVGVVLSVVVVVVVVLVIVYCRITNRCGAICSKNLKLLNASSSAAPTQSERNGAGDGTNTGNTHSNPACVSDDGVTSAYYLARDQECLCSVPNKPRHGNKAVSDGHPKRDNQTDTAGQDDYNHLSLNKSRAGPSSSPKQRRAAQPYDHLARGDEHHGDVTEPTPGDRRTGCGTRTLMADVLQSDEYNTLSITTLRASASSAAAPPSSERTYDHVLDGERGHQTWPAGDPDPTRASGQAEEVYEHTKW